MKPFLTFLLATFAWQLPAQDFNPSLLDSFMQAKTAIHHFNGNVLIAREGKVLYKKSFGYSDLATKKPLDEQTMFELGSISKQFTAMGILLLQQDKKLSLQDTLRKFFPELPYSNITLQHLLTHTSGLPPYEPLMEAKWDHSKIAFNLDLIRLLAAEKPAVLFQPGKRYRYSNTGYVLLASIIEKVTGKPFAEFMQEKIFSPLQMTRTRIYNTRRSGETIPNYAYGYQWSDSLKRYLLPDSIPEASFVYYMDGLQGDGVVNSTTGDLLKWDRALKQDKLLKPELQQQMLSPQAIIDSIQNMYYGYGLRIDSSRFGHRYHHGGSWPGYFNYYTHYIPSDVTIIVLSNNGYYSEGLSQQLMSLVNEEAVAFPYIPKEVKLDPALLDRYVGSYLNQGRMRINVFRKGDQLYVKRNKDILLRPESDRLFFLDIRDDQKLEFAFDENGKVAKAWFEWQGQRFELRK
ncbi:serine hydrolase [Flavihumibacter rivuli]|uniref:serine hydrolase n=1 Tax=Flavihumibacter rivuli TaxID=2838156 RepID=UPI001BDE76E3|nr:serine hydrolase [Flavihumibacter rivuli]ULQ55491.1 serine hydrolase [Flavihumibacter rivuli]